MKKTGWLIGIAISVALLFFLFFGIDYRQFLRALQGARYWYAVPIIGLLFLGCYLRALRWRWIMLPVKPIPVYHLFTAVVIGYMANDLLPARAGELVRAHVVGSRDKVSRATAFATIVVERLFDGLSVLVVMVLVLFRVRVPVQGLLAGAAWSALLLYLLVIAAILALNYQKEAAVRITGRLLFFLPADLRGKIIEGLESMAEGFKIVEKTGHLLVITFYSFLIWLVSALGIYITMPAFGYSISFSAAVFILVLLTFAVILPSSPGFVGTFHAGMTYGLMLFGVPREAALSAAIIFHAVNYLPIVLLGLFYMWEFNLKLSAEAE